MFKLMHRHALQHREPQTLLPILNQFDILICLLSMYVGGPAKGLLSLENPKGLLERTNY